MKGLFLKRMGAACLTAVLAATVMTGCAADGAGQSGGQTKVVLNEVAHSIFMRPCMWPLRKGTLPRRELSWSW